MQKISYNQYKDILKNSKSRILNQYRYDIQTGERKPITLIIPPLNTDINMSTLPNIYENNKTSSLLNQITNDLPDNIRKKFNWRDDYNPDKKTDTKKLLTPVGNQETCGCCWAYSIASAVSDNIMISNDMKYNPHCSITYLISCYPHCINTNATDCYGDPTINFPFSYQCGGGSISSATQWVEKYGISTDKCQNYSWCFQNKICNGTDINHNFNLNTIIPKCPKNTKSECNELYYISQVQSSMITSSNPTDDELSRHFDFIKYWIYNYGPAVGGFLVFQNFMSGNFKSSKNPDGIYIENVDYTTNSIITDPNMNTFVGGHAICIMGWGIGKVDNVLIQDTNLHDKQNSFTMVPYWVIRNSWSTNWGDNGYIHFACYPFNRTSQFDTSQSLSGQGNVGGIIVFNGKNIKESYYYSSNSPSCSSCTSSSQYIIYIIIIILIVSVITISAIIMLKKKK